MLHCSIFRGPNITIRINDGGVDVRIQTTKLCSSCLPLFTPGVLNAILPNIFEFQNIISKTECEKIQMVDKTTEIKLLACPSSAEKVTNGSKNFYQKTCFELQAKLVVQNVG
jgi:hypothetical protein